MTPAERRAYEAGQRAYERGLPSEAYLDDAERPHGALRDFWLRGWASARRAAREVAA